MDFIENAEMIIALITGLVGLVGTAISTFYAVKNWIKNIKTRNAQEIWSLVMDVADTAMEEIERMSEQTDLSSADKKTMAMDLVKASAATANLDITPFMQQLDSYIDQTIKFVNKMSNK